MCFVQRQQFSLFTAQQVAAQNRIKMWYYQLFYLLLRKPSLKEWLKKKKKNMHATVIFIWFLSMGGNQWKHYMLYRHWKVSFSPEPRMKSTLLPLPSSSTPRVMREYFPRVWKQIQAALLETLLKQPNQLFLCLPSFWRAEIHSIRLANVNVKWIFCCIGDWWFLLWFSSSSANNSFISSSRDGLAVLAVKMWIGS